MIANVSIEWAVRCVHWSYNWSIVSNGGRTAAECHFEEVLVEEVQYPHSCYFVNFVGVARWFKDGEVSDDREIIARVKEIRLHLRLNFFHHLGYIALQGLVAAYGSVG